MRPFQLTQQGREVRYALDRSRWEGRRRDDIELVGLDACRELFGA